MNSSMSKQRVLGLLMTLSASSVFSAEADTYLHNAEDYFSRQDYKAAVIELKNALQQAPSHVEARYLLGKAYLEQGDGASAEKELVRALDLGLAPEKGMAPLGRAFLMQGKANEVLAEIKIDDKAAPEVRAVIQALHGDAQLLLNALDKARHAYDASLKLNSGLPEALLGQARVALVSQEHEKAQGYVEQVLAVDSENVDGLVLKGELMYRKGEAESALALFSRAYDLKPMNFHALLGKTMTELRLRQFDQAEESLKRLLERAPEHPVANYFHAVVLFQRQELDAAEAALNKVLNRVPGHAQSLLLLGVTKFQQGDLEQAEYRLSHFVTAVPNNIAGRKILATVYIKLNQPEQAVETLDVIGPTSNDAQLLALLGTAYLQNGDNEKGTEYLQRAAELEPNMAAIRAQLALGRLVSGEEEAAVSDLEMAIDLGQDTPMADTLLVYTYLRQQDFDKAIAAAQNLVEKHPKSPMALNVLGVSYSNAGNLEKARRQFEKALELDPKYTASYMGLAQLALKEEEPQVAKQQYHALLQVDGQNLGAMLALARLASNEGDQKAALDWVNKARLANPKAIQPMLLLANAHLVQGEPLKALTVAREAYEINPEHPLVLAMLGKAQMANGDQSSAQSTFRKLVEAQSSSSHPLVLLAQAQINDKQFEAAAETLEQAIHLDKTDVPAHLLLGRVAIQLKQYERANGLAVGLQREHPELSSGYELEGDALIAVGKSDQAIEAYQTGFAKVKTAALAAKLHRALRLAGRMQDAVVPLEKWLQEQPNDDSSRLMLAMAYQSMAEKDKAVDQYEKILDAHPENIVVLNNLAWIYQEKGDKRALDVAQRVYDLAADQPAIVDTVGWIFVQNGRVDRGLAMLQEAKIRAPHIPSIAYHLAVAFDKAGRQEEARKTLQRLVRDFDSFDERQAAQELLGRLQ